MSEEHSPDDVERGFLIALQFETAACSLTEDEQIEAIGYEYYAGQSSVRNFLIGVQHRNKGVEVFTELADLADWTNRHYKNPPVTDDVAPLISPELRYELIRRKRSQGDVGKMCKTVLYWDSRARAWWRCMEISKAANLS